MKEINGRLVNTNLISDILLVREKKEIFIVYSLQVSSATYKDVVNDLITDFTFKSEVVKFDSLEDCLLKYDEMKGW